MLSPEPGADPDEDAAMMSSPTGTTDGTNLPLVVSSGDRCAAGGGRRRDAASIPSEDRAVLRPDDAEIKRMWVDPARRRQGLARLLLAELERSAVAAGCRRMVLETGDRQPEAIALYVAEGYREIPRFGVYRDEPGSRYFARRPTPTR